MELLTAVIIGAIAGATTAAITGGNPLEGLWRGALSGGTFGAMDAIDQQNSRLFQGAQGKNPEYIDEDDDSSCKVCWRIFGAAAAGAAAQRTLDWLNQSLENRAIQNLQQGHQVAAFIDTVGETIIPDTPEDLGLSFIPFGQITRPIKAARPLVKRASLKRIKRLITDLSKPDKNPGLSQKKLDQLRRIVDKAGGKVRVDLGGVTGSGVKPHAQVEGMGGKIGSRHIWLQDGVR